MHLPHSRVRSRGRHGAQTMMSRTLMNCIARRYRVASASIAIGALALAGCGRGGLNLAPVEGVVTYQGQPLADAGVLFKPTQGPFAMGVTDADGRFSLTTANQDGALIGDHKVAISKAQTITKHIRGNPFPVYETKPLVPEKYFDAATSNLTATVKDDDNHFEFNL
jgi:hypothetical protein